MATTTTTPTTTPTTTTVTTTTASPRKSLVGVRDAVDSDAPRLHTPVLVVPALGTQVIISRPPFTQVAFDEVHRLQPDSQQTPSTWQSLKNNCFCSKKRLWRLLTNYIPVIKFIRYYKLKEFGLIDVMAGLSVGTIHLPQALAFGLLASAKIENGLFTSLWPPLIYVFFGTSPHISMGTSAVVCLLTASAVDREGSAWAEKRPDIISQANGSSLDTVPAYMDFKEEVAMTLSLFIGVALVVLGFLRLGFITSYLSDSFFAAFTSAAAVHIGTTQLPPMLGITVPRFPGMYKLVHTFEAIFDNLDESNAATVITALICLFLIWFFKDIVSERLKHRLPVPIPIELFIVIFATIASHFGKFKENYKIAVVGEIPTGLPAPKIPTAGLNLASNLIADSIVMAILTFAYTIAIAKICAKKHNYEINDNQEMVSYGILNLASSFLGCIPSCVAPPRSMVASSMNAKTTLNGIFSCILMLLVIMVVASLFESLPKPTLAAIIFISLKNLFIQIKDVYRFWRINKFDWLIWMCTFFCTVFLDIDIGLYVGVGVAALTVVFQTQFAKGYRLGYTKNDSVLVVLKKYKDSLEVPGVKVFRFQSNLFYANAEIFRNQLYQFTVNPRKLLKGLQKREKRLEKSGGRKIGKEFGSTDDTNFIITGKYRASMPDLTSVASYPTDLFCVKDTPIANGKTVSVSSSASSLNDGVIRSPKVDKQEVTFKTETEELKPKQTVFYISNNEKHNLNARRQSSPVVPVHSATRTNNLQRMKKSDSVISLYSISLNDFMEDPDDGEELFTDEKLRLMRKIHHVILDCSPINYIDASGANVLMHIYTEYSHVNIKLYLAGCCSHIRRTMKLAGVFDKIPESHFFVDVHDAISYARPQKPQPIGPENLEDYSDEEAIENFPAINL